MKSCDNCEKKEVCRFRPAPYMGESSGGIIFHISYQHFATELFKLYGEHCIYYEGDK